MCKNAMDKEQEKLGNQVSKRVTDILNDPKAKEKLIKDMEESGDKSTFKEPPYR